MSKTVIALFEDSGRARRALEALQASGFVNERIQVQSGEEFVKRGQVPPLEHERGGLWIGIERFFEEIGLKPPRRSEGSDYHPISRDDAVVLLETSDERADRAAEILNREGAVDVEERLERKAEPRVRHVASGLEPKTSGKTLPNLGQVKKYDAIDERALAEEPQDPTRPRHGARIYGPSNEPYGDDWAPKGPTPYR